jgi:hypothetical protein
MINWFGPASWGAPLCATTPRVPAPVGASCAHCGEAIAEDDCGITMPHLSAAGASISTYHLNCYLRTVVGSVGHQKWRCSCYGGHEDDPPEMTRRQAADAAVALYEARQLAAADGAAITCPRCGRTSYNPNDIAQRYCGACHRFHEEG